MNDCSRSDESLSELQQQYLHGDCFDFADELSMQLQRRGIEPRLVLFRTARSRLPIHAAIAISDNVAIDASGIHSIGQLLLRWQPIIKSNTDERAAVDILPIDALFNFHCPLDTNDDEYGPFNLTVREDVESILKFTGVDIDAIKPIK